MALQCKSCKKFYEPKYKYGKGYLSQRKYCSLDCYQKNNTTKFKKGHKPRYAAFGKDNWMFGKTGKNCPTWKGGKYKDKNGYIAIHLGRGIKTLEHRLVMEKYLGRKLKKGEIVHHKNKNRSDNQITNLVLIRQGKPNAHKIVCPKCNFEWLWL